jgi:hypothetical protein
MLTEPSEAMLQTPGPSLEFTPRNAARRCQLTPALLLRGFSFDFGDQIHARVGFWGETGAGSPGKPQGYRANP